MATAPELLKASPEVVIRPMRAGDVADVVAIERASYQFPWSEGIFRDCLRVGYVCRVLTVARQAIAYGVMSIGAGEAHILNLCLSEAYRCRGVAKPQAMQPPTGCASSSSGVSPSPPRWCSLRTANAS